MGSKIIYVMLGMLALNLGLILFSCGSWDNETGACAGSLVALDSSTNATIWSLLYNPTEGDSNSFWDKLFGTGLGFLAVIGTVSLGAIFIGTTIFGKNTEIIIYFSFALGLTSLLYPSIKLWQLVNGLGILGPPIMRSILAIVLVSTMWATVMFTIIDWARGRD